MGNFISTNIADRNITESVCDFYKQSNWVISDFKECDSSTLENSHRTYCMHMHGCELWDLNCKYVSDFKVAWRKIKRCIWGLPYKSLLSANLHCIKSTFAENDKHLSYKYKICQDDWFMDINPLIAKMKAQFEKETQNISTAHTIVELCAIIIIYLYSFKTWNEYYKQCYTKNLHTMMSF